MGKQTVHAITYKDPESGRWVARCLEYEVSTSGVSRQNALEMIQEAVELHLEDMSREEIEQILVPIGSEPTVSKFEIHAPALLKP